MFYFLQNHYVSLCDLTKNITHVKMLVTNYQKNKKSYSFKKRNCFKKNQLQKKQRTLHLMKNNRENKHLKYRFTEIHKITALLAFTFL